MASVIAVHVWRLVPLAAVIMMAGLVSMPKDVQEAATVDGAGYWRRMFEITIPLTPRSSRSPRCSARSSRSPTWRSSYVLTHGGPTNATQVLASWAFFRGIEGGDVGQGAAIALFLFPLLLAAAIAILRAVRRMEVADMARFEADAAAATGYVGGIGLARVGLYLLAVLAALVRPGRSSGRHHRLQAEPGPLPTRQQPVPVQPTRRPRPR